jgi:hypothetical protein
MKGFAAIALIAVGIAFPVCAQRSASRGGFSAHSAPAFHGGSGFSGSNRFAGLPHSVGNRSFSTPRSFQRNSSGSFIGRPAYNRSWRYRRPYISPYGIGIPYGVAGWIGPGYLGYPDSFDSEDQSAAPSGADPGYDAQPAEPERRAPYEPATSQTHSSPAPANEEAVTLVFKDGRAPEQIHNYVLTKDTLYVLDQHHRDISLDQLDLVATEKLNRDSGVDFQLPDASR